MVLHGGLNLSALRGNYHYRFTNLLPPNCTFAHTVYERSTSVSQLELMGIGDPFLAVERSASPEHGCPRYILKDSRCIMANIPNVLLLEQLYIPINDTSSWSVGYSSIDVTLDPVWMLLYWKIVVLTNCSFRTHRFAKPWSRKKNVWSLYSSDKMELAFFYLCAF